VHELVALDLPAGPTFVDALKRVWDAGDVVLPLDQRLDLAQRRETARSCGAHSVEDESGRHALVGTNPMLPDDALVVPTSGTTGTPKAAVLTHTAVRASARASNESLGATSGDCWIACLPLAHVGGLSVITRALELGGHLEVLPRLDPMIVERITRDNPTFVSLVPALLKRVEPTWFRRILLGGGRPPIERPGNCVTTYGLTETGSGIVHDGRPLRGVELRIVDGEVLVRSPMNMRGYLDGTTVIDSDGWLHTGDEGEIDSEGRLSVAGRRGDSVNTGGEKVWPEVVESVLSRWRPSVEFCVVGVPDPTWGRMLVLVTTDRSLDLGEVVDVVRASLPPWCAPKRIVPIDEFPRTSIGKMRRSEISRIASEVIGVDGS